MGQGAKVYIYSVIAAGGCVLAASLANWSSPDLLSWTIYLVLAVLPHSVLVLPLMGLVYISYRVHVRQAVDRIEIPA